jgi:parallel beta-helix repeat protein
MNQCLGVETTGAADAELCRGREETTMMSIPRLAALAAAVLGLGLPLQGHGKDIQSFTVDCSKGQKIGDALQRGDERKALVLTVRGTCNENVTIDRDDVKLQGSATINGTASTDTITLRANRLQLENLAVRGGNHGIAAIGASNVDIYNVDIQGAQRHGIHVNGSASVTISGCSIQYNDLSGLSLQQSGATLINNNLVRFNAGDGVRVVSRSSVTINAGANISDNGSYGLNLVGGSAATVNGTTLSGNGTNQAISPLFKGGVSVGSSTVQLNNSNISNNLGRGINVGVGGSLNTFNTSVTGSAAEGVIVYLGASANLNGGTISGSNGNGLWVGVHSTAQVVGDMSIMNNTGHGIMVTQASALWTFGPPMITVAGNTMYGLFCDDNESSAADVSNISFSPSNGFGAFSCTGF